MNNSVRHTDTKRFFFYHNITKRNQKKKKEEARVKGYKTAMLKGR
jgi:hypothetical protein